MLAGFAAPFVSAFLASWESEARFGAALRTSLILAGISAAVGVIIGLASRVRGMAPLLGDLRDPSVAARVQVAIIGVLGLGLVLNTVVSDYGLVTSAAYFGGLMFGLGSPATRRL